jgi:N-acetylneuraminic acid mutarotase
MIMRRFLPLLLLFFIVTAHAQKNQWTWVKGDNAVDQYGVYGIQGTASTTNKPGSRMGSATWRDASGNFWLFGGLGFAQSGNEGYLNDLWKYDPMINQWTWVAGDNTVNQMGVYGTEGTAASTNKPGGREFAVTWSDASGNLWLFSGEGYPFGPPGQLNDLWKYNIASGQWTWVNGDNSASNNGVYGVKTVPNDANKPGARHSSVSWTDPSGNFWLFGGTGLARTGSSVHFLDDLWKYDPVNDQWTWMSGENDLDFNGTYGNENIPDPSNEPGGRRMAVSWTDVSGNLWLFGGLGFAESGTYGSLNDLWKYDTGLNEWTWVSGDKATGQNGIYGTEGEPNPDNKPSARYGATGWRDARGNFWLFGGIKPGDLNDLWKYDPVSAEWTWESGTSLEQPGNYGTQGVTDASNMPGSRGWAAGAWMDVAGRLWLLGGNGFPGSNVVGDLNDLWAFNTGVLALPLDFVSFDAQQKNNSVQLNWKTSEERSVSFFEVQRSADGRNFTKIGTVAASTASASIKSYIFVDQQPFSQLNFYRIKEVDLDGKYLLSRIAIIDPRKVSTVEIYPNPAKDLINVEVGKINEHTQITLLDATGRTLKTIDLPSSGRLNTAIDISMLKSGIYYLRINGETRKFLKN